MKYFPHLAGGVDSQAGTDRSEDWSELDAESGLVLLGRRPVGLQHLVGGLASVCSTPSPALLCHKDTVQGICPPITVSLYESRTSSAPLVSHSDP